MKITKEERKMLQDGEYYFVVCVHDEMMFEIDKVLNRFTTYSEALEEAYEYLFKVDEDANIIIKKYKVTPSEYRPCRHVKSYIVMANA